MESAKKKFKSASNQQTLPVFWTKITWRSAYEFTFNREDLEKIKKMLAQWKLLDENGLILRKFEAELIDLKALQILSESELRQLFEDLPIGVRVKLMEKIKKWQDRIRKLKIDQHKLPSCWSELPEHVWLRLFQHLSARDVNNLHLTCQRLHEVAKLDTYPKFKFSLKSNHFFLLNPIQPSRIFHELHFCEFNTILEKEFSTTVEDFLRFTGPHVKKLTIKCSRVDPKILLSLLTMLPNLEHLDLDRLIAIDQENFIRFWWLHLPKLKNIRMIDCSPDIESMLASFTDCKIEDLDLAISKTNADRQFFENFLKSQEKNLTNFSFSSYNFGLLNSEDLAGLKLEHLYIDQSDFEEPLAYLAHQTNLKSLSLTLPDFFDDFFSFIFELKNLEVLELESNYWADGTGNATEENDSLNDLYKLEKLRKLKIVGGNFGNILNHLRVVTFEDLEELDGQFYNVDLESIEELNRIAPKLKKLTVSTVSSPTINKLLETLANLEILTVKYLNWELPSFISPKIKQLKYLNESFDPDHARLLVQIFPNLDRLIIKDCCSNLTKRFLETVLRGLNRLEELQVGLQYGKVKFDADFVLECVKKFGKNLKKICVGFQTDEDDFDFEGLFDEDDDFEKFELEGGVEVCVKLQR